MERIDMVLSSGIHAHNFSIDCLNNLRSVRTFFKDKYENERLDINLQHSAILSNPEILDLCTRTIDNNYRVLTVDDNSILKLPLIFKFKGKGIKTLRDYYSSHVYSSIIKTDRVTRATYILYHYWFSKADTFPKVTNNVCIDIETIISIIINNSFTRYKDYIITNDVVEALRSRLSNERLLNIEALI
jgi:hypothetical protein